MGTKFYVQAYDAVNNEIGSRIYIDGVDGEGKRNANDTAKWLMKVNEDIDGYNVSVVGYPEVPGIMLESHGYHNPRSLRSYLKFYKRGPSGKVRSYPFYGEHPGFYRDYDLGPEDEVSVWHMTGEGPSEIMKFADFQKMVEERGLEKLEG